MPQRHREEDVGKLHRRGTLIQPIQKAQRTGGGQGEERCRKGEADFKGIQLVVDMLGWKWSEPVSFLMASWV